MMTLLLPRTSDWLIGIQPVTNLLWFSLASIVVIALCVRDYLQSKLVKELLNRLLEKNGIAPIGEERREAAAAPEPIKRKMTFPMRMP